MQVAASRALTPPAVAARLGINADKVLTWIRAAELNERGWLPAEEVSHAS